MLPMCARLVTEPTPFPTAGTELSELLWHPLPSLATTGGEGAPAHSGWSGAVRLERNGQEQVLGPVLWMLNPGSWHVRVFQT